MSALEPDTAPEAEAEAENTPSAGIPVGQPCGVCRFPVKTGQICGNLVYATKPSGTLPKYCGAEGQDEWQAKHQTRGEAEHTAIRSAYGRRRAGNMTTTQCRLLAEAAAAELGITPRPPARRSTEPTETTETSSGPRSDAPDRPGAEAPPVSPFGAVTLERTEQLAGSLTASLAALREELRTARVEADNRVAAEADRTRAAYELKQAAEAAADDERRQLTEDLQAARAEAEAAHQTAEEAAKRRLQAEGALAEAHTSIQALRSEIAALKDQHHQEFLRVAQSRSEADIQRAVEHYLQQALPAHLPSSLPSRAGSADTQPAYAVPDGLDDLQRRVWDAVVAGRVYVLTSGKARGQYRMAGGNRPETSEARALTVLLERRLIGRSTGSLVETAEGQGVYLVPTPANDWRR